MYQKTTCPHCKQLIEVPNEFFNTSVSCPACKNQFNPMNDHVKASYESLKTPAFQGSLKALVDSANENITHPDFVAGLRNQTIGLKCMFGNLSELITGGRKAIFNMLVLLYVVAPAIIISWWAYHEGNWWLLIGIVVASLISPQLAQRRGHSVGGSFLLACIVFWFFKGIHNYFTFFSLSALWGYGFFRMAERAQNRFALQSLIDNPELFYEAIDQNKIMIVHKDQEDQRKAEELAQEHASTLLDRGDEKYERGDCAGAIIEYTKAIETYPFVSAFENRGDAKMKLQDYDGAIMDYSDAIRRMPSIPDKKKFSAIYRKRGEAKCILKLNDEAQLDFIEADRLIGK